MQQIRNTLLAALCCLCLTLSAAAQQRRPIDSRHPAWLVHIDVWNKADPQKIIDLIPADVRPFVIMNLSLSCQYDTERNVYKMPQNAVRTYKSWATVCQQNGLWFTCQPASGGHTHIQDDDLETFEYFFKHYPNFLGWNYAEQFWGFDEVGDRSSSSQANRIALFAKLVRMSHAYGGFLTVSFCGNIWSHLLNPLGMMKRNADLLKACEDCPEAILWLYKYTTSSCFYNNESVTFGPFIAGLAKNYGVRYDNCGWNGALSSLLGEGHGCKYPVAAGIGTVMEQTCVNGGAMWDGPELIWTEDFQNLQNSTVSGYTRRNWGVFPGFANAWLDMFQKVTDGTMYIPTRQEVVEKTKIVVVNNVTTGNDENKYAAWGNLYDGLYKQTDPFNRGNGQWMDNFCYFKSTGRYGAIPVVNGLYDELAKRIPVQVNKSAYASRWSTQQRKVDEFNRQYEEVSTGDLYVNRFRNQLVTYTPYTYLNARQTASARIPLCYNTCDSLLLTYGKLSSGIVHEYADHIDLYLNNYRSDTTTVQTDIVGVTGATERPTYTMTKRAGATASATDAWDEATGRYTLSIKHNGPVEVSVACAGTATGRSTDTVPDAALELPVQPALYNGPVIIEAEDMDYKDVKSCVLDPYNAYPSVRGHAGNGFMDMGTNASASLRHICKNMQAGAYDLIVRYSAPTKGGYVTATMNSKRNTMRFEQTGTNEWRKATVAVNLKDGDNTLVINNIGSAPIYIDQIIYQPAGMEPERFDVNIRTTEHGTVMANVEAAAEGETVSLTALPDEGFALTGWNIIHGDVAVASQPDEPGVFSFAMPDENVTLQPVFTDTTVVYALDYADVLAGTIPTGWRCVQESNTVHEYPQNFTSGARTMVGFAGYQGKALYWRDGSCEYGRQSAFPLHLSKGKYQLTFAMAAWKATPRYSVKLLSATTGRSIATSASQTATPNANGNQSADVSAAKEQTLSFNVATAGDYIISFQNLDAVGGFDEFLLLKCQLNLVPDRTGVMAAHTDRTTPTGIYNLQGMRLPALRRGVNIVRMPDGSTRKVVRK